MRICGLKLQGKRRPGCWRSFSDSRCCSSCLMTPAQLGVGLAVEGQAGVRTSAGAGSGYLEGAAVLREQATADRFARASRSIMTSEMVGARDAASVRVCFGVVRRQRAQDPRGEKRCGRMGEQRGWSICRSPSRALYQNPDPASR